MTVAKRKSGGVVRWQDAHPEDAPRRGASRAPVYLAPWVLSAAMLPVGMAAHAWWGDAGWGTGLASAAIVAAGAALTWVDYRLTRARSWWANRMSTVCVAGGSAWLAAATAWSPTGRPVLDAWLLGGVALSVASNLHTWARAQGEDDSDTAGSGVRLPSWGAVCARIGLDGVRMRITRRTDTQVVGTLQLAPGQTVDSVQARLPELASAMGVAPGAVQVREDRTRADRGTISILLRDVMGDLIPWPGPTHVGASIADAPLELGIYADGEPYTDAMVNAGGVAHTLTMGMPGSGKSVHGKVKTVSAALRRDTFTIAVDLSKGKQTLGPILPALGWAALNDKKAAKTVMAALRRAIQARADYLGERGYAQWTSDCGLVFLYVLLEEAADLVDDFDELVELLRTARSAGIKFDVSLQRASWGSIDTDARASLGDGVCFGVRSDTDAGFVLPDHVTDAGARPETWGKSRPGASYAAVEHQPVDRHAVPIKMYGPPSTDPREENRVLAEAAAQVGDMDARLDPITRGAFGQPYADYAAARRATAPTTVATPAAPVPALTSATAAPIDTKEPEEPDMHTDPDDVLTDEETFETPDPDPTLVVSLDEEMPQPVGDLDLPPRPRSREGAEQARAALETQLAAWVAAGVTEFRAPELGRALEHEQGVHRSRSWVIGELRRLVEEGRLAWHDGGEYEITLDLDELAGV